MSPRSLARAGFLSILCAVAIAFATQFVFGGDLSYGSYFGLPLILMWPSLVIGTVGVWLILKAGIGWLLKRREPAAAIPATSTLSDVVLTKAFRMGRNRPMPAAPRIPDFGMFFGCILYILVFFFMIAGAGRPPFGLTIRFSPSSLAKELRSPESETLGVYVAGRDRYYVNGRLVPKERLRSTLQRELSRRVVWLVYFEADDDCPFGDVVYAIDVIKGLGAQPSWMTPQTRKELD
jgi:biopolymer transport protein ExbD